MNSYYVKETPMYPNSFKVISKLFNSNSFVNYFPTKKLALEEAKKRNKE